MISLARSEGGLGTLCGAPGCVRPREHRRFCEGHRKQLQRGKRLSPLRGPGGATYGPCAVCGGRRNRKHRGTICGSCRGKWQRRKAKLIAAVRA